MQSNTSEEVWLDADCALCAEYAGTRYYRETALTLRIPEHLPHGTEMQVLSLIPQTHASS